MLEVPEADVKAVLWVRLSQEEEECLVLAVCYIPLESSSRGEGQRKPTNCWQNRWLSLVCKAQSYCVETSIQDVATRTCG